MDLRSNQSVVYYKTYLGETEIVDQYGNATGQYNPSYSSKASVRMVVSSARGNSEQE